MSDHSSDAIVILVTTGSTAEARRIAIALVEQRLAACVQILSEMLSVYRWQDAVRHDPEYLLLIKTTAAHFAEIETEVRALHSYTTPEIIALPIMRGSQPYLEWLQTEVKLD